MGFGVGRVLICESIAVAIDVGAGLARRIKDRGTLPMNAGVEASAPKITLGGAVFRPPSTSKSMPGSVYDVGMM